MAAGAAAAAAADDIESNVLQHVDPNKGLTNALVRRLGGLILGEDFCGVFSADRIPPWLAGRRFIIIVNLGTSYTPVGHFVTLAASSHHLYYVDPYGLPCYQPHVIRFMGLCGRPVLNNLQRVQDAESVYCGFFTLLFAKLIHLTWQKQGYSAKPDLTRLVFYWRDGDLRKNDQLCIEYLKRLIYE